MTELIAKRKTVDRSISSLKPHPKQGEMFGDLNTIELKSLAEDMEANGLQNPIEILNDGTIICGHQRVEAAKILGWKTIACWLRDDLEALGENAVEARFIEDNLNRRQMPKLTIARCYLRSKQLKLDSWDYTGLASGDLRDHLALRFGMSGRQLDRYARMLDAPIAVQRAFEQGRLSQKRVLAFLRFYAEDQQAVLEAIEAGEDVSQFMDEMPLRNPQKPWSADRVMQCLVRALVSAHDKLDGRMQEVSRCSLDHLLDDFETGLAFLLDLHECIRDGAKQDEGDMEPSTEADYWTNGNE
jgi:ParB-like chromosome segregation protein Spo0J